MTSETEQKILNEIASLKVQVAELHSCLTGDRLKDKMGILDILETHRRELYGCEDTQDIGLKNQQMMDRKRIESLEGDRIKVVAVAGAVSLLIMVGWALVKTFILK